MDHFVDVPTLKSIQLLARVRNAGPGQEAALADDLVTLANFAQRPVSIEYDSIGMQASPGEDPVAVERRWAIRHHQTKPK